MDCDNCPTLVPDIDSRGGCADGTGDGWELSVLCTQFSFEPKTALKIKLIIKQKSNLQAFLMACCSI